VLRGKVAGSGLDLPGPGTSRLPNRFPAMDQYQQGLRSLLRDRHNAIMPGDAWSPLQAGWGSEWRDVLTAGSGSLQLQAGLRTIHSSLALFAGLACTRVGHQPSHAPQHLQARACPNARPLTLCTFACADPAPRCQGPQTDRDCVWKEGASTVTGSCAPPLWLIRRWGHWQEAVLHLWPPAA